MEGAPSPGALGRRSDPHSRVEKPESVADKMAALKARVATAISSSKAKGGLGVGLHPVLEELSHPKITSKSDSGFKHAGASGSSSYAGRPLGGGPGGPRPGAQSLELGSNPYYEPSPAGQPTRQKEPRRLVFNQKGKHIQQANALRRQAALEAMKKRIAEQTRKAGIEEDLDLPVNFVDAPPDTEWWDEGLVGDAGPDADWAPTGAGSDDSVITELVQHPVAIEPPQAKNVPAPKPMFLTTREQKKVRRQRRAAELKEKQAKVRLGLLAPEPPKITRNNMMVVLAEQAVKDPTAVEAQVNREIAKRHDEHMRANEERKLTREQRHDKLAANQEKDAAKGLRLLAFRINSLANGQHRYRIGVNAEQHALTGICIMHPAFSLVVVEGGAWGIAKYKKLMLERINWTENAPSREKGGGGARPAPRQWLVAEDEKGALKDISHNECRLIFEGEVKSRSFRKWGSKVCETDAEARELLARVKMDNFWTQARSLA